MPGMAEEIDGAVQQAPQPGRQLAAWLVLVLVMVIVLEVAPVYTMTWLR
jgi:hypothetical protein